MNKKELVDAVSEMTGFSKIDIKKTLEAITEAISAEMQKNEKVIILGFGTFSVKDKAARMSIHPQTMQALELPAKKVVRFKPSQYLNNLLVQKKKRGRPRIEKGAEQ
ncbi:HU family DNA-binding protein [Dysgonomonas sp. 25]|uniref:HU family DNA-binding protein n=1 Tax=Dysgonomonas sp. 25 TaxID=2302933 RepID=UPI0013D1FBB5|nr:HU family DNA-binding protein [Dysgonomonas sp. 25]NDV68813.1 HU family DNA-binding protein [Dysgonomonas sp. 25]